MYGAHSHAISYAPSRSFPDPIKELFTYLQTRIILLSIQTLFSAECDTSRHYQVQKVGTVTLDVQHRGRDPFGACTDWT